MKQVKDYKAESARRMRRMLLAGRIIKVVAAIILTIGVALPIVMLVNGD